jgi:hypothetical protein
MGDHWPTSIDVQWRMRSMDPEDSIGKASSAMGRYGRAAKHFRDSVAVGHWWYAAEVRLRVAVIA